ncbi:glyoxalase/bleomycin resistance/dioxygenase family protein [Leptobacterium flavescens]|uniref:Glyoxalase/bleomycin resistance/dioxygenase family protein n=1 Tax=Leptobacterium flavescens TaxID=472055 RepID=A0A6P0UK55_9FLAO|nr:ArsI/CadI family heavy metal resistance metalloenzyme [Leptobacterium flavescens]NER12268.1 glyoxalase/bleomycin resistance/dioxygenase family protein [Leptobacterium flavescens]
MNKEVFPRMHVSLYVSNLAATVNFYSTFFRKPADKIKSRYAKYILDSPSLIISFIENPERVQSNFGHLGFQVSTREEMEQRLELARKQDIVHKEEIGTACCYAVQDKFWVNDPDNIQWEVYYFHEDAEFNDPHYELQDTSACCMPAVEEKPKVALAELSKDSCDPNSGCC